MTWLLHTLGLCTISNIKLMPAFRKSVCCADISGRPDRCTKFGDHHQHQPRDGVQDAGDSEHPRARRGCHDMGPIRRRSLW